MNPFLDILKADVLSPDQATKLFVPEASPIWEQIQHPINQIVIGPRGAGKTMAIKQLDHRLKSGDQGDHFIGIYLQISRICTIFGSIFDYGRTTGDGALTETFMRIFADYVWLEIVREIVDLFVSGNHIVQAGLTPTEIQGMLGIDARTLSDADLRRSKQAEAIEQTIQQWSTNSDEILWTGKYNLPQSLDRCAMSLRSVIPGLNKNRPCIYLLLDESSPIPVECQVVLNGLLHRGRSYCVKLAIRPYEWETMATTTGRTIELDTDVWPLQVRYPLDAEYAAQMAKVVFRVLRTHDVFDKNSAAPTDLNHIFSARR